jgi:uncharacterized protein with NRDE domain
MCLIVFAWRPGHPHPLVVAANRDEFYARPTAPLAHWQDHAGVYAGRDLEAGGTWLGIGAQGRFAALTNIRQPGQAPGRRSRGELVAQFLTSRQSIEQYVHQINQRLDDYAGFNLLLGDGERLCYLSSLTPAATFLEEGFYGLSNAGLDTPWPKLLKARDGLREAGDSPDALLTLLADATAAADNQLPDTGVGLVTEKLLSSVFIASPNYGTRASTVLIVQADGQRRLIERSFGPHGGRLGEVHLTVAS